MSVNSTGPDLTPAAHIQTLDEAEKAGLKLAIKGRTIALVLLGGFMIVTRSADPARALEFLALTIAFASVGLIHFYLIGSAYDRWWLKYLSITIDLTVLSTLVATQPMLDSVDLPQVILFRNTIFPFYFVILGVAAFSFSPRLVLWAGGVGIVGWLGAFLWAIRDMPVRYEWTDLGTNPTTEHFVSIFLNPNFIGTGSRVQEAFAFGVVAVLIAVVVARARRTVMRQLELDDERKLISDVFGKYVPQAIAQSLISEKGALEPVEKTATILFADIAEFTNLTESKGPQGIVEILNDYFDGASEIISAHNGVITQFQGDAILATFNVPIEDADHAENAVNAAIALHKLTEEKVFGGTKIRARIGICTGPIVAGNVGGSGRLNYTVHGNTVNLAARLETLNKEYQTNILIAQSTREQLGDVDFLRIGAISVRGISTPVDVYSVA